MALTARRMRWMYRLYPPYLGAGIRVTEVADDWSRLTVEMPLTRRNRNYVGTQFGGSLYSMCDPHLMLLLIQQLGPEYVVWDQAASIRFVRPGRSRVTARFVITPDEVEQIRADTASGRPTRPEWTVEVTDVSGTVVAVVDKTLYVRRRS